MHIRAEVDAGRRCSIWRHPTVSKHWRVKTMQLKQQRWFCSIQVRL